MESDKVYWANVWGNQQAAAGFGPPACVHIQNEYYICFECEQAEHTVSSLFIVFGDLLSLLSCSACEPREAGRGVETRQNVLLGRWRRAEGRLAGAAGAAASSRALPADTERPGGITRSQDSNTSWLRASLHQLYSLFPQMFWLENPVQ